MRVISGTNNVHTMLMMYSAVSKGYEINTRGAKCRNVRDMAVVLNAGECPVTSFKARDLNLNYAKEEWLWYLRADPMDDSIEAHAKMWAKLKQPNGSYYSNYGQYLFGRGEQGKTQFDYVINVLSNERDSRRASMMLLKREHLFEDNSDTVCTYAINFAIIGDCLDMTVLMRSNDVIFGFTNDAFCFWNLYAMVYAVLKDKYPELVPGQYTHFANSMHVYERHYDMIHNILMAHNGDHYKVQVPWPTKEEAIKLVMTNTEEGEGDYTTWLKTRS